MHLGPSTRHIFELHMEDIVIHLRLRFSALLSSTFLETSQEAVKLLFEGGTHLEDRKSHDLQQIQQLGHKATQTHNRYILRPEVGCTGTKLTM